MNSKVLTIYVLLIYFLLNGCGERPPTTESLLQGYATTIEERVKHIENVTRSGNILQFPSGKDNFRVEVLDLKVMINDDEMYPYAGVVKTKWFVNGKPVDPIHFPIGWKWMKGETKLLYGARSKRWQYKARSIW